MLKISQRPRACAVTEGPFIRGARYVRPPYPATPSCARRATLWPGFERVRPCVSPAVDARRCGLPRRPRAGPAGCSISSPSRKIQRVPGVARSQRLVAGEGLGGHHRQGAAATHDLGEVDHQLAVHQGGLAQRGAAQDVAEVVPAAGEEVAAVGQQEVEDAVAAQVVGQPEDHLAEPGRRRRGIRPGRPRAGARAASRRRARCRCRPAGASVRSGRSRTVGKVPLWANTR